jgi:hypothetical protein
MINTQIQKGNKNIKKATPYEQINPAHSMSLYQNRIFYR